MPKKLANRYFIVKGSKTVSGKNIYPTLSLCDKINHGSHQVMSDLWPRSFILVSACSVEQGQLWDSFLLNVTVATVATKKVEQSDSKFPHDSGMLQYTKKRPEMTWIKQLRTALFFILTTGRTLESGFHTVATIATVVEVKLFS